MAGRRLGPLRWLHGPNPSPCRKETPGGGAGGRDRLGQDRGGPGPGGRLGAEIVNADSLQVYRELDIGTAKPTLEERARVPHHLIDVADPPEPYDAARYCREGREVLDDLLRRGVPALVVGGTGLYLKALLSGLFAEGEPAPGVRDRVRRELGTLGLPALYAAPASPGPGHRRPAPPPRHLPDRPGPGGDFRPPAGRCPSSSTPTAFRTPPLRC